VGGGARTVLLFPLPRVTLLVGGAVPLAPQTELLADVVRPRGDATADKASRSADERARTENRPGRCTAESARDRTTSHGTPDLAPPHTAGHGRDVRDVECLHRPERSGGHAQRGRVRAT